MLRGHVPPCYKESRAPIVDLLAHSSVSEARLPAQYHPFGVCPTGSELGNDVGTVPNFALHGQGWWLGCDALWSRSP